MKKNKLYITIFAILFSVTGYSQLQLDHSLMMTGSGANARITGIKSIIDSTDAVSVQAVQNGALVYATSTGSNNAFNISISPPVSSYKTGMVFYFISNQTVTGAATLSVNGLAAVPIVKYTNVPLSGCEIITGQAVTVLYDGTNFQVTSVMSVIQPSLAPVATAGSSITQTQFSANWNAVAGASSYNLDVATDSTFSNFLSGYNNKSVGNVTTAAVTGITCGNTYYYRVRATSVCGVTANSNTISQLLPHSGYVPITLTNSAAAATGSNFQQMLSVNSATYSAFESAGLENVEFTVGGPAGTGTVVQAWIESGNSNSSSNTVYWLNLGSNSMAANGGTITVYMNFMPSSVLSSSGPTGEAAQLSSTYGQFDNGANVFQFYDNFAGTSLNTSLWSSNQSGCYSINNGLTYIACSDISFLQTNANFNNVVVDENVEITGFDWIGMTVPGAYAGGGGVLYYNQGGWSMLGTSQLADGNSYGQNTFYIISGGLSGGVANLSVNYALDETSGAGFYPDQPGYLGLADGGGGTGVLQWIRVRTYPPAFTMPSVILGNFVPGC